MSHFIATSEQHRNKRNHGFHVCILDAPCRSTLSSLNKTSAAAAGLVRAALASKKDLRFLITFKTVSGLAPSDIADL